MASNPEEEAFKELEKRYEELRKKSGMSNEQLDKMIGYNYEALSEEVDDSTVKTDWHKSFSRQLVAATGGGGGVEG